jgi:hypothetical protein
VLDVERGDDVDARVEQGAHVRVPLGVPGPGDVGVGQLVHQGHLGPPGQHRVEVHLRQQRSPVLDCAAGHDRQVALLLGDRARSWVSTNPITTSVPRSRRRRPSLSMAKVLPTPGAAPR